MTIRTIKRSINRQSGMVAILLSIMIAAGLLVSSMQTSNSSSMSLYHASNQDKIEAADQLLVTGMAFIYPRVADSDKQQDFYHAHNGGHSYTCSDSAPLPTELAPLGEIEQPASNTPEKNVRIRYAFAPYSCTDSEINHQNFRLNIEITANVGCDRVESNIEDCVSRSVTVAVKNAKSDITYNPIGTPPPPPPPKPPDPPCVLPTCVIVIVTVPAPNPDPSQGGGGGGSSPTPPADPSPPSPPKVEDPTKTWKSKVIIGL